MKKKTQTIDELLQELSTTYRESVRLASVAELLEWDQEVFMPAKASAYRAETVGYLAGLAHERLLSLGERGVIHMLEEQVAKGNLKGKAAALVRECARDVKEAQALPNTFVQELAETTSNAVHVWQKARSENNFRLFAPHLEEVLRLSRDKAAFLAPKGDPYDALLDTYETGATTAYLAPLFAELRDGLVPIVKELRGAKKKPKKTFTGTFALEKQRRFSHMLSSAIGFDAASGRLDESTHPFTVGIHPSDVRITTRYDERDPWYAIGSTIHEAGHALYEQGLPEKEHGTPLGQARSLGVHESQSRFWENMIGKQRSFWKYFYPKLKKSFADELKSTSLDEWYGYLHQVTPSLIRTESDEVTYNLHIIVRFEIERLLVHGSIEVKDLPQVWNEKMYEYLGVRVPDDTRGVLQDTHWACGLIGYFPTYTLGNLYAAALYDALLLDIPDMEKQIAQGEFAQIKAWLHRNVYRHGRTYSTDVLMRRATGSGISVEPFLSHIKKTYYPVYGLSV